MVEQSDNVIQNKLLEVIELMEKFQSQSQQINKAENRLDGAVKKLDDATVVLKSKVLEVLKYCESIVSETQKWADKATEEIFDLSAEAGDTFEAIKGALEAEKFMDLCEKLRELVSVLEDCKTMCNNFESIQETIINAVNSKIVEKLSQIKKQQEDNRKFMEEKFAELFKLMGQSNTTKKEN